MRSRRLRSADRTLALPLTLLAALSCSVAAETPEQATCMTNEECTGEDEVCSFEQGGVCVKAVLPPRDIVGLFVRENSITVGGSRFFVEMRADDKAVQSVTLHPTRFRIGMDNKVQKNEEGEVTSIPFPGVRDELTVSIDEVRQHNGERFDLAARFELAQSSRIGRASPSSSISFEVDEMTMEPIPGEAVFAWPHYHSSDVPGGAPVIVAAEPEHPTNADKERAVVYRQLIPLLAENEPSGRHTWALESSFECQRRLDGYMVVLPGQVPFDSGSVSASLSFEYASPTGDPMTLAHEGGETEVGCNTDIQCPAPAVCVTDEDLGEQFCGCESDDDCSDAQYCDTTAQRCALDLTGFTAGSVQALNDGQVFQAQVYTYCDSAPDEDRDVDFIVTLTPDDPANGLPKLSFRASQEFTGPTMGSVPIEVLDDRFCLPNWQPAIPVEVPLSGAALDLGVRPGQLEPYVCCNADCLLEETPVAEETCTPEASLTFTGTFRRPGSDPDDPEDTWDVNACLDLYNRDAPEEENPDEVPFTRSGACDGLSCTASVSPGPLDEPLVYEVAVAPVDGSLFRSEVVHAAAEVSASTTTLEPITLGYRVLVRGRVAPSSALCDARGFTEGCALERDAEVLMERIRLPSEQDQDILGPFEFETTTYDNRDFQIAVNPGVYLISAFPAIGSQGAASRIRVIDLRLDSPLVTLRDDGVPLAGIDDVLELDVGRFATVELSGFDNSTEAEPVDLGSWTRNGGLSFEGAALDLNDPATCYNAGEGCRIRRLLFNAGSSLISQEKFVTFTTRE